MTAEELADAAEQLVSPATFMLAYRVAQQAYAKDPQNIKAAFYVHLLKRFEAFRGIVTRVRPALTGEQLVKWDKWSRDLPESPLKKFLFEKGKPFKNVYDSQEVMDDYYNGVREFRAFLKKNQNANMDIYLNPHVFADYIKKELYDACEVYDDGQGNFEVECPLNKVAVKKLNVADMIALRQIAAGELLYSMFNSYSLEGVEKLEEAENSRPMTSQEKVEFLSKLPRFGFLRKNHVFSLLKEIGSDLSGAIKWAQQHSNSLCPNGAPHYQQRPGHLFHEGFCTNDKTSELTRLLDRALGGIITESLESSGGQMVQTRLDAFAWTRSPIQDLRQVKPVRWNNCGQATALADNTLGGIFVDNNYNLFMDTACPQE